MEILDRKKTFISEEKFDTNDPSRVSTGIKHLDELLLGGFPKNSIILVSGTPGSGKTILCFHFIDEGIKRGEKCLYFSSEGRLNINLRQAEALGFNFKPEIEKGILKYRTINLEEPDVTLEIEKEMTADNYNRVVIDSLSPISEEPVHVKGSYEIIPSRNGSNIKRYPPISIPATRRHIKRIIDLLGSNNCTSIITSEIPEGSKALSRDTISEFMADGIIKMDIDTTMDRRKLVIRKMRATHHTLKPQDITINYGGIKFL